VAIGKRVARKAATPKRVWKWTRVKRQSGLLSRRVPGPIAREAYNPTKYIVAERPIAAKARHADQILEWAAAFTSYQLAPLWKKPRDTRKYRHSLIETNYQKRLLGTQKTVIYLH